MNEESGFRDAIAANPADDTARLVFADWLDEWDRREEACEQQLAVAIRQVIAEPDDDAPRLRYATICETYGRGERAEFIRVQCEFERLRATPLPAFDRCTCSRESLPDRNGRYCGACARRAEPIDILRKRAIELWLSCTPVDGTFVNLGFYPGLENCSRGFLHALTCTAADWLTNCDTILAQHPIREVRLTTPPGIRIHPHPQITDAFEIVLPDGRSLSDIDLGISETEPIEPARLLSGFWPGITFRLTT